MLFLFGVAEVAVVVVLLAVAMAVIVPIVASAAAVAAANNSRGSTVSAFLGGMNSNLSNESQFEHTAMATVNLRDSGRYRGNCPELPDQTHQELK